MALRVIEEINNHSPANSFWKCNNNRPAEKKIIGHNNKQRTKYQKKKISQRLNFQTFYRPWPVRICRIATETLSRVNENHLGLLISFITLNTIFIMYSLNLWQLRAMLIWGPRSLLFLLMEKVNRMGKLNTEIHFWHILQRMISGNKTLEFKLVYWQNIQIGLLNFIQREIGRPFYFVEFNGLILNWNVGRCLLVLPSAIHTTWSLRSLCTAVCVLGNSTF